MQKPRISQRQVAARCQSLGILIEELIRMSNTLVETLQEVLRLIDTHALRRIKRKRADNPRTSVKNDGTSEGTTGTKYHDPFLLKFEEVDTMDKDGAFKPVTEQKRKKSTTVAVRNSLAT